MQRIYMSIQIEQLVDDLSESLHFDQDLLINDLLWKPVFKASTLRLDLRRMLI